MVNMGLRRIVKNYRHVLPLPQLESLELHNLDLKSGDTSTYQWPLFDNSEYSILEQFSVPNRIILGSKLSQMPADISLMPFIYNYEPPRRVELKLC
uniref:Uncharacterized protein n=1 Tax=Ditylenchus dipsaci TaxID=166011 RepID=A0A915DYF0_9BILA